MHEALRAGRAPIRGSRRAPGRRRVAGRSGTSTASATPSPATCRPWGRRRGPGGPHDVQPHGVRRGRPRRQQARGCGGPVEPGLEAAEVGHALDLTAPVHAVADGASMALLAECSDRTGHRPRRPGRRSFRPQPAPDGRRRRCPTRRGGPRLQLGHHRAAQGGASHPRLHGPGHAPLVTVLGLGQDDRFQVATPPSHILGLLNLLAAVTAGATVRLHRRFDLDEVLARIAASE